MIDQSASGRDQADMSWGEATRAAASLDAERSHPPRTFTELLPVSLTETELADRAKKAAHARRQVAEFESQKKAASDHWKAKVELAENERDALLDVIASGVEDRHVEVIETFEYRTGTVTVTRTDTQEKIRERAMTSGERQPELFDVAGNPRAQAQLELESGPLSHDGDDADELDTGEITDPDGVLGDEGAPAAKVIRRKRTS